jgi:hypothetical protein
VKRPTRFSELICRKRNAFRALVRCRCRVKWRSRAAFQHGLPGLIVPIVVYHLWSTRLDLLGSFTALGFWEIVAAAI